MTSFFEKEKYHLISSDYMEREITQIARKIIRYISRRDKRFISSIIYRIIRFIFMPVIKLILKITESIIYNLEKKSNYKNARSRVYVFKKFKKIQWKKLL